MFHELLGWRKQKPRVAYELLKFHHLINFNSNKHRFRCITTFRPIQGPILILGTHFVSVEIYKIGSNIKCPIETKIVSVFNTYFPTNS